MNIDLLSLIANFKTIIMACSKKCRISFRIVTNTT